tara:strand:- start:959 stop:1195 length:237 start_codon:yes stop_codon:yes gene_type:complete
MNKLSFEYMKNKTPKYKEGNEVYKGSVRYKVCKPLDYDINNKQWRYQLVNTITGVYEYIDEKDLSNGIFTDTKIVKGW